MPGLFNVQNALAAIAVCEGLGIPEQCIYVGLMKARVPGRMEVYSNADEKVSVIVDYAHNRMSFETLFQSVREEYPGRRVVTVFGCPGYKAYDRRKDLGEISGKYADLVILTEEDAGEEPVEDICRDIAQYVEQQRAATTTIVPDRGRPSARRCWAAGSPPSSSSPARGGDPQKRGIEYIDCPSDVDYAKQSLHEYDVQHGMDGMSKVRALLDVLPPAPDAGRTIVIKYGGSAPGRGLHRHHSGRAAALQSVGVRVVLVHGGGKEISALLERLNVESHFENGYRVTDEAALDAAEMAPLRPGEQSHRGRPGPHRRPACGLSGRDGGLITARRGTRPWAWWAPSPRWTPGAAHSPGGGYLPVVSPIARAEEGAPSTATPTTRPGRWPRPWGRTSSSSSPTPTASWWTATTSPPASPRWT